MSLDYIGSELELFARAANWKAYVARHLSPFIRGRVLEVGAGIGSNITQLMNNAVQDWLAVEPDQRLAAEISRSVDRGALPANCRVLAGTIDAVKSQERFDSILYIDVLEHIDNDRAEAAKAAERLAPGGHLIVLVPAHQFLYSPFDRSIGHFRRYALADLKRLTPPGCRIAKPSCWTVSACSPHWQTASSCVHRCRLRPRSRPGTGPWCQCRACSTR